VNTNFIADAGFTPRLYNYDAQHDTLTRADTMLIQSRHYVAYPKTKKTINSVDFAMQTNGYYTSNGSFIEFNGVASVVCSIRQSP
jgi:hypothetical protein